MNLHNSLSIFLTLCHGVQEPPGASQVPWVASAGISLYLAPGTVKIYQRVCGQFQGPEAQGPPPPGALAAPWWQVRPPLAPGGLRGTALGSPFHSARVQRGTTKTRRCPSPATATPRSTARRQPRLATQVGGFGALFYPHADPASATKVKTNSPPPVPPGTILL